MAAVREGDDTEVSAEEKELHRPHVAARRQSSFSDAFNKITSNPFNRRRTTTLSHSSTFSSGLNRPSRIPTPSGIPRSTSFFNTLSSFASKSTSTDGGSEHSEQPVTVKPPRKVSDRLAQTPFFNHQHQRINTTPSINKQKCDSGVQIEHRGLMAPLHPPLPRSSTMGNLASGQTAQSSPRTPSFMRSTSSSAARRGSINTPKQRNTPMPSVPSSRTPSGAKAMPTTDNKDPGETALGRHPTRSAFFNTTSRTGASQRQRMGFSPRPPKSTLMTIDNTNIHHSNNTTGRNRDPHLLTSSPSGRLNRLPSPKERRMGWCQTRKPGRRHTSTTQHSSYSDNSTQEAVLSDMNATAVNKMLTSISDNTARLKTVWVDAVENSRDDVENHHQLSSPLVEEEHEDIYGKANLTAVDEDSAAATPEPTESPFPIREMSNPRLVSSRTDPSTSPQHLTPPSDPHSPPPP